MDTLRAYVREKIAERMGPTATRGMVANAEISIYNYCTRRCISKGIPRVLEKGTKETEFFKWMYKQRAMSILFNLGHPKNPGFLKSVLSKDVECRHLGFLTREQIFPELWNEVREKLNRCDPSILVDDSIGTGGIVRCPRCKDKGRVHVSIVQTRSADEGSTLFCYCAECQKRWKIYT